MTVPTNTLGSFLDTQKSLEASYHLAKPHVNPKTGVIPWVTPLPTPWANGAFHIYFAKHPILGNIKSLRGLLENIKSSSSAIGRTPREAKILATCEALERWSCVSQGRECAMTFSYNEIKDKAIAPDVLHCISDAQYANRKRTNLSHPSGGGYIPEPLNPDHKVLWCPVFDYINKEWKYVLKSSCFFGHDDDGHVYSATDSRGVAAGPTREFCVWNALLELIETDAGAIWNANRLMRPEVDMMSFNNPFLLSLKEVHDNLGRDVWVLDISMDIAGVVVFAVISQGRNSGNIIKGFGTHPLAHKALEKAFMECCQMLPNVIGKKPATSPPEKTYLSRHLLPDPNKNILYAKDYSSQPSIKTIHQLAQSLVEHGITPLIQDVSRPELGLCVMRVFGPGMRSWFDRRSPGRLFDVPVQLGLQTHPLSENELNPVPVEG